jgi:hypothetical protein
MGQNALVDVHIQVSPRLSVSEGHHISEAVEKSLIDNFEEITDVTVHIDPEDDEATAKCKELPLRSELIKLLRQEWDKHDVLKYIDSITLHYLDGKVDVEACLPLQHLLNIAQADSLKQDFDLACKKISFIGKCRLSFC